MTIDKADSPIEFRLDPSSGVPTYLQLVQQVEHALRLGYLKLGDQLPKVRDVVAALTINPNTVLKAYKELEVKGLAGWWPCSPACCGISLRAARAHWATEAPPAAVRAGTNMRTTANRRESHECH